METIDLEGPLSKTIFDGNARSGIAFSWDTTLGEMNDDPHFHVQSEIVGGESPTFEVKA